MPDGSLLLARRGCALGGPCAPPFPSLLPTDWQLPLHPSVFLRLLESVDGAPTWATGLLDFLSGLPCH